MIVLLDFIREVYSNNAIQEVKLAFQMALSGKLDCERSHYQNFSSAYFGGIMAAYRVWASQVHDYHERTRQEPKQIEQAPIEMPDDEYVKAAFEVYKALKSYEAIPENIYFILESQKKIDLSDEQKWVLLAQVQDKLAKDKKDAAFAQEYAKVINKKAYIQALCRRKVVARYFEQLIFSAEVAVPVHPDLFIEKQDNEP